MELDKVKQKTTWNDASGSINSNFEKIRQAIVSLLGGGGGSKIEIDSEMSDTSENAVQNKVVKQYVDQLRADLDAIVNGDASAAIESINEILAFLSTIEDTTTLEGIIAGLKASMEKYTDDEVAHIEGVINARIDSLEVSNVYNVYYTENNELSEEQLEANKKAYAALASEEKAAFYLVQEGNVYSRLIVSTTMKSASTEAIAVEAHIILPIGNKTMLGTTAINLYSDGHISMTVVQTEIPNMEEVWQEIDKKQDILVDGQNIKTINGESILGEGNIEIQGGASNAAPQIINIELSEEYVTAIKKGSLNHDGVIRNAVPIIQMETPLEAGRYTHVVANGTEVLAKGYTAEVKVGNTYTTTMVHVAEAFGEHVNTTELPLVLGSGSMTAILFPTPYKSNVRISGADVEQQDKDLLKNLFTIIPDSEGASPVRVTRITEIQNGKNYAQVDLFYSNLSSDASVVRVESRDGSLMIEFDETGTIQRVDNFNMMPKAVYDAMNDNGDYYTKNEVNDLVSEAVDYVLGQGGNGGGAEVRTLFVNDAGLSADELSYNAETVQLIFAQHPMIFFASTEEGTPLSEYELMGMDNGRMVFARYELNEYSTGATYIYLAMDGSTEVGGFSKSELDGDKYDSSLDADSTNAVQNKVVTENIRALEAAMPLIAVIDLDTIIAQDTPIDNATRNALLELGGYTAGDKYFSKGWIWSRGYLYTIKVIPTDAGVQIHVLSLKGWCEILEDNSKVNHLPSQGGGSIEVDSELSETSENAVSNKAVTMALAETEEVAAAALNELNKRFDDYATKEDLEDALADVSIEVDSAMSDTSENAVSNKTIKKYVDDADKSVKEYVDDADNALSERISALEQNSGGGASVEVDAELSESSTNAIANKAVTEAIVEDEEVISVALNQMNTRFDGYASLDALATEIQNAKDVIDASIIDNEEVAAAALVDLDKRLKDILTILGNAGLIS